MTFLICAIIAVSALITVVTGEMVHLPIVTLAIAVGLMAARSIKSK